MSKNTEIERKFLVKSDAFMKEAEKKYEIVQGYLCKEPGKTIRVRIRDDKAFLTIKSGRLRPGIGKFEWEREIDLEDAKELMMLCLPGVICKTRYVLQIKGVSGLVDERVSGLADERKWEVDVFHGHKEGLVLAEIELEDENEVFEKPEWLGEEVTGQPEYYNANM